MDVRILSESVQGASHKLKNIDCQDSFKWLEVGDAIILSVADGHGSQSCPYSKTGSQVAVNVFCDLMSDYYKKYSIEDEKEREKLVTFLNREGVTLVSHAIEKEWKRRIERNHRENKREMVYNEQNKIDRQKIWRQYGTTLLGLVITPEFYFAFQLGDGDILFLQNNKAEPIVKTEKILGTETYSLSRKNAWEKALSTVGQMPNQKDRYAFILATDGFSNSYPDEKAFLRTCSEYYKTIQNHGIETVLNNLKNWLNETSENGSGDDITVIFAVVFENK
jgi:serine/threonine protein phosphatase PrpC